MAITYNPRIVTDNLVLALDAANQKSWYGDGTTWKDVSGKGNNGTLTGPPLHSQGPFPGAGSVFFDGQGNHSQLDVIYTSSLSADFDLSGNIDSTVECWVYLTAYPGTTENSTNPHWGGANIFSIKNSASSIARYYHFCINTNGTFYMSADYATGSFPATGNSTSVISLNTWYHIAWVRDSGSNRYFLNGTEITSEFSTPNASNMIGSGNSKISIGADFYQSSTLNWLRPITGYISNFRLVNGTALYTSNFTPQISKLTAVPNTKLLTCQGNSITDASSSQTLSLNGGPTATYNDDAYFSFDGTNDYVESGAISDWKFLHNGAFDFTIEAWVYFSSSAEYTICATGGASAETGMYFGQLSTSNYLNYQIYRGQAGSIANFGNSTSGLNKNKWNHAAFTFDSSSKTGTYYVNGVSSGSTSQSSYAYSSSNPNYPLQIGRYVYNSGSSSGGYYNGRRSIVNIYKDKSLTASEIQQNFNALRGRYQV